MSSTLVVPAGRLDAIRLARSRSTAPIRHRQSCCFLVRASRDEDKQQEETIFVLSEKPKRGALEPRKQENELPKDEFDTSPGHRSGYVALIGKPNVGKSTLLNGIIGQKLSIVTPKPQTTRHRILGLCSASEYQMILYDTPGVLSKRMHKLDELMMKSVRSATINSDILLLMADICQAPENVLGSLDESAVELIKSKPTLLVLNKKDLIKPGEINMKKEWYEANSGMDAVMPISAKNGEGVQEVKEWLISHLPFGPAYYPKDIVSEHQERFFVAEILREKIFQQYREEIPYSCQVNVTAYKEREPPAKDYIQFEILVEKESQRMILLGKDGKAIKTLATAARLDIEDFVGRKCFLEIKVKVKENWRKDEKLLQNFGYAGSLTPASF